MKRKIANAKNPILRKKAKKVIKIDRKILSLIEDMRQTLESQKDPEGVAIAAPQIGKNLAIFVVSFDNFYRAIINPKILKKSKKLQGKDFDELSSKTELEGCLSIPHFYCPLARSQKVKISYTSESGKNIVEEFSGFAARVIQHEIDHLNGVLFTDHVLSQKKPLYKFTKEGWEEVEI